MAYPFNIVERVIPGQHIREYPNATRHQQEDPLFIAIKQYIPQSESHSSPATGLTIIGGHGAGFPKVSMLFIGRTPSRMNADGLTASNC